MTEELSSASTLHDADACPPDPRSLGTETRAARLRRFLLGYDLFISYRRADANDYARHLANRLIKRGFRCYLDQFSSTADPDLPPEVVTALERSTGLVVIGSPGALESPAIAKEIATFSKVAPLFPIDVAGTLSEDTWGGRIRGISRPAETADALKAGIPSRTVILALTGAITFRRRNEQLKRTFFGLLTLVGAVVLAGVVATALLWRSANIARAAEAAAREEAETQSRIATEKEKIAAEKTDLANVQSALAEDRRRQTYAQELAARARAQVGVDPERGVLLALEAAKVRYVPDVTDALRQTLAQHFTQAHWLGHTAEVATVRLSSDGALAVTTSLDATARVWRVGDSKPLRVLSGHKARVRAAVFSPDGRRIVTASDDRTARIWDTRTGESLFLLVHRDEVHDATFSPDGALVATASADGTAGIWDSRTGKRVQTLAEHGNLVNLVNFSPDGSMLVTAGWDNLLRTWDCKTWRMIATLRGSMGPIATAVFSDSGDRVLSAGDSAPRMWDSRTGAPVRTFAGHSLDTLSAVFDPTGKFVATASADNTARIFETATGRTVAELRGHKGWVQTTRFSPDGKWVVTAGRDSVAKIWEMQTGRLVADLRGHAGELNDAVFTRDGTKVITVSDDRTARAWQAATGHVLHESTVAGQNVTGILGFSPDGRFIVEQQPDKATVVRSIDSGQIAARLRPAEGAYYNRDGTRLLIVDGDGRGFLVATDTWRIVHELHGCHGKIQRAAFSPAADYIVAACSDDTGRVWRRDRAASIAVLQEQIGYVTNDSFSPAGDLLVTGAKDATARVWKVGTWQPVAKLPGGQGRDTIFTRDGSRIVTHSTGNDVQIWKTNSWRALLAQPLKSFFAAASPLSTVLITAGLGDHTALVTNLATGEKMGALVGHSNIIDAADFSPDGKFIATGSWDNTARIWEVGTWEALDELRWQKNWVGAVSFVGGGAILLRSLGDKARVYSCELCLTGPDLIRLAQSRVRRDLTADEKAWFLAASSEPALARLSNAGTSAPHVR